MRYIKVLLCFLLPLLFTGCPGHPSEPSDGDLNGNRIFYTIPLPDGRIGAVYSINADGTDNKRVSADTLNLVSAPAAHRIAAVRTKDGRIDVVVLDINADGTASVRTVIPVPGDMYNARYNPILSPKGDKLLYTAHYNTNVGPNIEELYIADIDGGNTVFLTTDVIADSYAAFSPDGSKVAFMKPVRTNGGNIKSIGSDSLFVVNTDGTGRRFLTDKACARFAHTESVSWSPDGTRLVCESETDTNVFNFLIVRADGGGVQQITDDSTDKANPVWSPTGDRLAYTQRERIDRNWYRGWIYTINSDGTGKRELYASPDAGVGYHQWSPDGSTLLVSQAISPEMKSTVLKTINANTGVVTTLVEPAYRGFWYRK